MKNSWHVIFVSVLLGAYLAGFGIIRAGCDKARGPFVGAPRILIGPAWYPGTRAGDFLSQIYWPMFWLEQKITGEEICNDLTERRHD